MDLESCGGQDGAHCVSEFAAGAVQEPVAYRRRFLGCAAELLFERLLVLLIPFSELGDRQPGCGLLSRLEVFVDMSPGAHPALGTGDVGGKCLLDQPVDDRRPVGPEGDYVPAQVQFR